MIRCFLPAHIPNTLICIGQLHRSHVRHARVCYQWFRLRTWLRAKAARSYPRRVSSTSLSESRCATGLDFAKSVRVRLARRVISKHSRIKKGGVAVDHEVDLACTKKKRFENIPVMRPEHGSPGLESRDVVPPGERLPSEQKIPLCHGQFLCRLTS